jgi:hypothetical protein
MAYIGVPPADRTSGARVRDEFTADGTQVCFQLSQEVPGSFESNIIAVVENVIQEPVSAYTIVDTVTVALTSISGTFTKNETITGGTSAATGTVIQVNASSIVIKVASGTFQAAESITGGSSSATATISTLTTNIGRGLNFSGTPTNGTKIYALHQASATYNLKPAAGSVTPDSLSENLRTFTVDKFTATSSQTAFTLSTAPVSVKSILVFVDGVMQTETTHYTLSGVTLTIGSALTAGQQVSVVHLGFSTVSRTAFTDGSVTTAMIADGAITSDKIATGGVATIDMADGSVTSLKIANGGIAAVDLASDSVTTAKILDANVTADKLASDSVTTAKILNANVTAGKLASGAAVSNIGYTPANKAGDTFTADITSNNVTMSDYTLYDGFATKVSNGAGVGILSDSSAHNAYLYFGTGTSSSNQQNAAIGRIGGDVLSFFTASTSRMSIDASGRVTKPYQPVFSVTRSDGDIATASVHVGNVVLANVGSHYNTSNGRFTAPVTGVYAFHCYFMAAGASNDTAISAQFFKNGSGLNNSVPYTRASGESFAGMAGHVIISLTASDYVELRNSGANNLYGTGTGHNAFSGYLIG